MEIIPIVSGPVETNGYLIIDSESSSAVVVDVPLGITQSYLSLLGERKAKLEAILLTHTHWDHSGEAQKLKNETGAKVYVHKADDFRLKDPAGNSVFSLPFDLEPVHSDIFLEHMGVLKFGSLEFEIRHTPGHTEGGICFVDHKNELVFTGDTLFYGSIGRTDFPGGSMKTLLESIESQLATLPDHYKVYSGHGPESNIGFEKKNNPFLNQDTIF